MTARLRVADLPYGYTLRDLDSMARMACAADRSLSGNMTMRYQVAWSAIALALVEAPHWLMFCADTLPSPGCGCCARRGKPLAPSSI